MVSQGSSHEIFPCAIIAAPPHHVIPCSQREQWRAGGRERCHDTRAHHRGARDSLESETSNLLTSFTVRLPIYAAQLRPNKYSVLSYFFDLQIFCVPSCASCVCLPVVYCRLRFRYARCVLLRVRTAVHGCGPSCTCCVLPLSLHGWDRDVGAKKNAGLPSLYSRCRLKIPVWWRRAVLPSWRVQTTPAIHSTSPRRGLEHAQRKADGSPPVACGLWACGPCGL